MSLRGDSLGVRYKELSGSFVFLRLNLDSLSPIFVIFRSVHILLTVAHSLLKQSSVWESPWYRTIPSRACYSTAYSRGRCCWVALVDTLPARGRT